MRSLISQLRLTIRGLIKTPGFTITAVLILGLGIGANTAIFSLVDAALLKPLPYPDPERLVRLFQPFQNSDRFSFDYPDYLDFSANQHSFDSLAVYLDDDFNLAGRGDPVRIGGLYVSGAFFRLLGRQFLIGRPFGEAEDRPDAPGAVVVSEHLWRSRLRADPNVIGTRLTLNGRSFQVIGVTPAQANESEKVDLYVPLGQSPYFGTFITTQRGSHNFACIGRLKERTTVQEAQADLEVIRRNLAARYPATNSSHGIRVVPYLDSVMGDYSATLWMLEAAVTCLLLITCANVGNLLLARAQNRQNEISIRAAMGASRLKLIVQLLLESSVLAVVGGVIGMALGYWALDTIRTFAPQDIIRFQEVKLDGGAFLFVSVITVLTALFSGLFPAFVKSNGNLASSLKLGGDRGGTASRERHRGQDFLVVGQVALTSLLLIGASLLLRSFQALQNAPLGFNPNHILTADVFLTDTKYATQAERQAFFDTLVSRVRRMPGVTVASFTSNLPFRGNNMINDFGIAGEPDPEPNQVPVAQCQLISPDYFKAIGMPLLRGRGFTDQDVADKEKVVIISESIARRFFPGQDPIGKQLHDFADSVGLKRNFYTIVGLVADVQHNNPESQETPFQAYYPYAQNFAPDLINWATLAIHAQGDPRAYITPLNKIVADLDPNLPLSNVDAFGDLVARSLATKRLAAVVVSVFSGAALLLAAVGLYGVLCYSVAQRKREIGVRIALGAKSTDILRLVIKQGLRVVGVGLVVGVTTALALSHTITGILYRVSANDLVSISLSIAILSFSALIACLLPALRATRIDPITALRE